MRVVKVLFCLSFSFLLIGFIHTLQAEEITPIWRIGRPDNNFKGSEFNRPPQIISIDYIVPSHWEELYDDDHADWGEFPRHIYTSCYNGNEEDQRIQEININFPYTFDSHNPTLAVRAKTSVDEPDAYFGLQIMKFHNKIPIGLKGMYRVDGFFKYEFPLGLITGGALKEKNEITIRCLGPPNGYILFDAVYLYYDDTDSDHDGVWDTDEDEAKSDPRIVNIQMVGRDPADKKRFTLKIKEPSGTLPYFENVRFVDPNTLAGLAGLKSSYYFPYGFLGFQVNKVEQGGRVTIHITYQDTHNPESKFSPFLYCFVYQGSHIWQDIDFSFLGDNTISITLLDRGNGDIAVGDDGFIDTVLAFSYPQELDVTVDNKGCFLECIVWR